MEFLGWWSWPIIMIIKPVSAGQNRRCAGENFLEQASAPYKGQTIRPHQRHGLSISGNPGGSGFSKVESRNVVIRGRGGRAEIQNRRLSCQRRERSLSRNDLATAKGLSLFFWPLWNRTERTWQVLIQVHPYYLVVYEQCEVAPSSTNPRCLS